MDATGSVASNDCELIGTPLILDGLVLHEGRRVMRTGDPVLQYPGMYYFHSLGLEVAIGGAVWHRARIRAGAGLSNYDAIFQGSSAVVAAGQVIDSPGFPSQTVVTQLGGIGGVVRDGVLFTSVVEGPGHSAPNSNAIRVTTDGRGRVLSTDVLIQTGDTIAGLPGPVLALCDSSMSTDGRTALCVFDAASNTALVVDGVTVLRTGDASPIPGLTYSVICAASVNAHGEYAVVAYLSNNRLVAVVNGEVRVDAWNAPESVLLDPLVTLRRWHSITRPVLDDNGTLHTICIPFGTANQTVLRDGTPVVTPYQSRWNGRLVRTAHVTERLWIDSAGTAMQIVVQVEAIGASTQDISTLLPVDQAERICRGVSGPSGRAPAVGMYGSRVAGAYGIEVVASGLPAGSFMVPLASQTFVLLPGAFGANGALCVGGTLSVGDPARIEADGSVHIGLDADILGPSGQTVAAGERWGVQLWYRAQHGGGATSRFSECVAMRFE